RFLTTASLRSNTSARKFPVPHAGSRKRESMRSVSCFTKSSMAFTSCSFVYTSPWSLTRFLDFTCLPCEVEAINKNQFVLKVYAKTKYKRNRETLKQKFRNEKRLYCGITKINSNADGMVSSFPKNVPG